MATDTLRLDSPAAQKELEFLRLLKVGETRYSPLFPALSVDLEWNCTAITATGWTFVASFCRQPLIEAVITQTDTSLVLNVKEVL